MKFVRFIVTLLMVVGSLNWGLIGFFGYDFVSDLFGGMESAGARVVFALVGLAGLYGIGFLCKCVGKCCGSSCGCSCHKKDQK